MPTPKSFIADSDEDTVTTSMPKSFVADSTNEEDKPKEGFLSRIASDVSDFVKNHPKLKEFGERLLTGTSPEFEDLARNKAIESIKTGWNPDSESNRAELSRLEAGGKQQILGDPAQEKSLLPSFKQPETFAGGFMNSLYEDFIKPLATPSGILSSSAPETSIPIRQSALHKIIDENTELPAQKLLEAPKTRFSVDAGGNAVDRTADLPIRSIERPYRSFESFSTASGDTDKATRAFNESIARHQAAPEMPSHQDQLLDALSVKNEFEPWKGLTNIKEGLGRLGENFLSNERTSETGPIHWGSVTSDVPKIDEKIPVTRIVDKGLPSSSNKDETWIHVGHLNDDQISKVNDMYKSGKGEIIKGYINKSDLDRSNNMSDEFGNEIAKVPTDKFKSSFEPLKGEANLGNQAIKDGVVDVEVNKTKPIAKFIGWQEDGDGGAFPLYDIEGGASHKSTVDAAHLEKLGIDIPETPKNPFGKSKFFDEPATQEAVKPEETTIARAEEKPKFVNPFEKPVEAPKSFIADEVKPVVEEPNPTIVNKEVKKLNPESSATTVPEPTEQEKFAQSLGAKNGIVELQGGLGGVKPPKSARPIHTGPGGSAVNKLYDALESAHGDTESRMRDLAAERARRFAAFDSVKDTGVKGAKKSLGKLAGEYESYEPSDTLKLGRKQTDDLFTAVKQANITAPEKARGYTTLFKLINGNETLQRNELKLLDDVFGGHFAENIIELHGGIGAVGANIGKVANTMKAMMSSVDLSAPLRQGIGLVHRPEWRDAFGSMFKFLKSQEAYDTAMKALEQRPSYLLGREAGLFLAKPDSLLAGEEAFMNNYLHNIPGVRKVIGASERAYTGFLNKLRADTFDNLIKQAKIAGNDAFTVAEHTAKDGSITKSVVPTDVTKNIAKFVNNATGRGTLGSLEKIAPELNTVIWSPRLLSSRLTTLNPKYYAQLDPFTRKEALKSLLAIGAFGTTMAGLGALAGGKVGTNPLSADFGKARFGNKVLDPWGGFQQPIVAAARFIKGSNEVGPQGRDVTAGRFAVSKLSPIAGLAYDLASAKIFNGKSQEADLSKGQLPQVGGYQDRFGNQKYISQEIENRFVPIFVQDMTDVIKDNPSLAETVGLSVPALFGAGTQDYPERSATKKLQRPRKFPSKLSF